MPHILFCDSSEGWGGLQQWMLSAATGMKRVGWRVTVAGRAGSALLPRTAAAGIRTVVWPFRWELDLVTFARARGFSREDRPQLAVVGSGRDIRSLGLAARQLDIPVIWRVGGRPKFAWFQRLTRDRLVDHALVPSEYSRELLRLAGWKPETITVIPNGIVPVDPLPSTEVLNLRHRLGIVDHVFLALFVGTLRRVKQVDVLLRAFQIVLKTLPQSRLAIVGSGVKERELQDLASQLGIAAHVDFLGFRNDPADFLNVCDLLVLPSREETFGWVLLEAMTRAKAVVASDAGAIPEVVGREEAGLLVPSGDIAELAAAIQSLGAAPARREQLGQNGARRVRTMFTEDLMLERLEHYFQGLLP
jgi:glycosyltransferase involved in cell wall biosynthesis